MITLHYMYEYFSIIFYCTINIVLLLLLLQFFVTKMICDHQNQMCAVGFMFEILSLLRLDFILPNK